MRSVRKLIKQKKYLFVCLLMAIFLGTPVYAQAATHDFSLNAYDWDVTANDWEGDGTEEQFQNGDYLNPGQVVKTDIYYSPGDVPVTSMQIGIKYNPDVVEVISDGGIYFEADMSTTYQGGIWPAAGTSTVNKKKTNWLVQANDDTVDEMVKVLIQDKGTTKYPLVTEGVLVTVYFKVKDTVATGTPVSFEIDSDYTKVLHDEPKTVTGLSFMVASDSDISSNANLDTLTLTGSNGTAYLLDPAFTSGTSARTFHVVVPNSVTSITIAATVEDITADILAGGLGNKALAIGDNSFNLVVQSQDGHQEIYAITVRRLSNNASLNLLSLSGVTLDYPLSSGVFTYTATVPYQTKATSVSATATDPNATVTGTGNFDFTNYGDTLNTKTVTVQAEDCKDAYKDVPGNSCTSQNYVLNVTRTSPSSDNTLSDLKVNGTLVPGFASSTDTYTLTSVPYATSSVNVTATPTDPKASVAGTGNKTLNVGDNTITVTVTAEDKSTKTYTINIRRLSNNANLASMSVTSTPQGTLAPAFVPTHYNSYTYTYDSTVSSIEVAATLEDSNATIVSGTGTYSSSDTSANIVTTAEDGTTKTYVINFSRNKSSDNNLKSLSINGYNLNETFAPNTTSYTATVPGTVDKIRVDAVANESHATITGDGEHNLVYGPNTIKVTVAAENGAKKEYTIVVTKSKKNISALTDLKVDGTTVPDFSETKLSYDIGTVPNSKTEVNVSAALKDSDASVAGTGNVPLNTGDNTITVTVTAHNNVDKTIYTIHVYREKSANTYLSSLTLQEKAFTFNKTQNTYNINVDYSVTNATINAVTEDQLASASVSGPSFLSVGLNTYTITVTAEDGTIGTYTLNITRAQSTNTDLTSLSVTHNGTDYLTDFSNSKDTYNITVDNEVDQVDITAVKAESTNQTVTGTGTKSLSVGVNTYVIEVRAASGKTKTYTINITRSLNGNNNLKSLEVVDQTLSPAFTASNTNYNVTVDPDTTSIVIQATAEAATSTIVGTGTKAVHTGTNTFNVEVTSEDHKTKTYVIVVTKQASSDSSLASLSLSEATFAETFNKGVFHYTATVPNNVTEVTVNATASSASAKSVTGVGKVSLTTGENTISVVVTAEDNSTSTYTIVVTREKSNNANLASLTLSGGYVFNEPFHKDTTHYTVTVPNSVSKITVSATLEDKSATVTGTGEASLTTGKNTIPVTVTAEDKTTKTYTIDITRELSSNTNLKALSSSDGLINPTFNKNTKDYTLTVPYEVENATITATAEDGSASVSVTGNTNLKVGTNNVTITVTAEDGSTDTYKVVVTRQPSSNNYLQTLEVIDKNNVNYIDPFSKKNLVYTFTVMNDIDEVVIKATAEDATTTVTGTGTKSLKVGENNFIVTSTSGDGTAREYVLKITRKKNANNRLSSLSVDSEKIVPDFNPETLAYSLSVDATVSKINIKATAEASTSTVTGTGEVNLSTGINTFPIVVTSEDGQIRTYTLSVSKAASSNNALASLLADQTFTPIFEKDTLNYSATVSNEVTTINIQAVAEDPNATVTGVGTHNLAVGTNTIEVTVTAEDTTFRIYTIEVYREPSDNNYLSDLKVGGVTVNGFERSVTTYSMTVENNVTQADVVAVKEDAKATVQGDGTTYLTTGLNTITITVTAESGDIRTYTINITRKKSSNAYLAALSSLEGTLSPVFNKGVNQYTMDVPYEITNLTLTTVVEDANATVATTGNENFQVGSSNTVTITVTAEDGSKNDYQIQVTRLPEANNFLSDLTVTSQGGTSYSLTPGFHKNTLNYSVTVASTDTNLVIGGTKETTTSSVVGFDNILVTAFPYVHKVVVTSASGVDRTYTITIEKEKSSDASLKGITLDNGVLDPAFDPAITDYTVHVDSTVSSIDIEAVLNPFQTVAGDGTISLKYGENTVSLVVTAEDGTMKTYTIHVIRDQNINSTLDNIEVLHGTLTPQFKSEVVDYIAFIGEGQSSITITPTVSDLLAKMTISLNDGPFEEVRDITVTDFDKQNIVNIKVEGTNQTTIYKVAVMKQSTEKITSEKYGHVIEDGMIKTVTVDTTVEQLKDQLDNENTKLEIYEQDGITLYTGNSVGTGMIVKLVESNIILDQKVIVVKGDTDGNGMINAIDALKVVNHVIQTEILMGPYLEAADTTNDQDEINAIDALKIVNHIIGSITLY